MKILEMYKQPLVASLARDPLLSFPVGLKITKSGIKASLSRRKGKRKEKRKKRKCRKGGREGGGGERKQRRRRRRSSLVSDLCPVGLFSPCRRPLKKVPALVHLCYTDMSVI